MSSTTTRNPASLSTTLGLALLLSTVLLPSSVVAQDLALKDDSEKLLKIHGALMVVAWGVIFPIGALLAVFRHKVGSSQGGVFSFAPNFYIPHTAFQMLGFVLVVLSMICGARAVWLNWGIANPFKNEFVLNQDIEFYPWNKHVKWGLATLFLLVRTFRRFSNVSSCFVFLRRCCNEWIFAVFAGRPPFFLSSDLIFLTQFFWVNSLISRVFLHITRIIFSYISS